MAVEQMQEGIFALQRTIDEVKSTFRVEVTVDVVRLMDFSRMLKWLLISLVAVLSCSPTWATCSDPQVLVKIPGVELQHLQRSQDIVKIGSQVWIVTKHGVVNVDRQLNRVSYIPNLEKANRIVPIREEIWGVVFPQAVRTAGDGLFRFSRSENGVFFTSSLEPGKPDKIIPIGNEIWFTAADGAYIYDRLANRAVPIEHNKRHDEWVGRVFDIFQIGTETWIHTEEGLFKYDRSTDRALPIKPLVVPRNKPDFIDEVFPIFNDVFVSITNGNLPGRSTSDDSIYLVRFDPTNNVLIPITGETHRIADVVPVGNEIWIASPIGVFRLDRTANALVPIDAYPGQVQRIRTIGNEVWIATDGGAYRLNQERKCDIHIANDMGFISDMVPVGDEVWFASEKGVFRWKENWALSIELKASPRWAPRLSSLPPWLSGFTGITVRYPIPDHPETIDVIVAASKEELAQKLRSPNPDWTRLDQVAFDLKPTFGRAEVHLALRDSWGNLFQDETLSGWVIPSWEAAGAGLVVLSAIAWLISLVLSPYVRACQLLLMNRYARIYGSFGIVPLILTVALPARRHLLKRYCNNLKYALTLDDSVRNFVVPDKPFEAEGFQAYLTTRRTVLLYGQSGIGKSAFLRYFAQYLSSTAKQIPILVDLSVFQNVKVEDAIVSRLDKFGDISDKELVLSFLRQGGFVFLIDGVNEVDYATVREIAQFVDTERNRNFACLTTQVPAQEMLRVSTPLEVKALTAEKIDELVRKLVHESSELLSNFTPAHYAICQVPLQLELLVDTWTKVRRAPSTLDELFRSALDSVISEERWAREGHQDYPLVLFETAFQMVVEKRAYKEDSHELPEAIYQVLVEESWLVSRGAVMEFRHDKVRGYLASRYFTARWQMLLKNSQVQVDSNWDSMIQFHLSQEKSPKAARMLLFLLLVKDIGTAKRSFDWLQANRPGLAHEFSDEFSLKFGKRLLGLSDRDPDEKMSAR